MSSAGGLTGVTAPDLRTLLSLVKTERLPVPITQVGLQSVNLGHLAGRLGCLDGADRAGVLAAISVTLALVAPWSPDGHRPSLERRP